MAIRNEGVQQAYDKIKAEPDTELIAIVHHYGPGGEKEIKAAKLLLDERQLKERNENRTIQVGVNQKTLWILGLTVGIFILTVFMVILMVVH